MSSSPSTPPTDTSSSDDRDWVHSPIKADHDLKSTPSSRLLASTSGPTQNAKKRVDKLMTDSFGKGQCIITGVDQKYAGEYAHILMRSAKSSFLTALEFIWGRKYSTLNVDSSLNMFILKADIHKMFDDGWLILLPTEEVLKKYMTGGEPNFVRRNQGGNPILHGYQLVAHPEMRDYVIFRQNDEFGAFTYPYEDFPVLSLHVHPAYMTIHAGRALVHSKYLVKYLEANTEFEARIRLVAGLYNKWTSKGYPPEFTQQVIEIDDKSSSSIATRSRRVHQGNARGAKRQRADTVTQTPSKASKASKVNKSSMAASSSAPGR